MAGMGITAIEARKCPVTAVLFAGLGGRRKVYEWWGTFQQIEANIVAVHDEHMRWWQQDTEATAEAIGQAVGEAGGGRVVGLGASAGGFGALLFGSLCGFDATMAFVPQTICGPGKREMGDSRWPNECLSLRYSGPYSDLTTLKLAPSVIHVANDPLDMMHCGRVRSERVFYRTGGHNLPEMLKKEGRLHEVVSAFIRRDNPSTSEHRAQAAASGCPIP